MKKVAFLFPGQGSQSVGMGKDLYDNFEAAKNVFDIADKTLGKSISTICFEGPEDELKLTVNTQPSIVTTSIAALEAFKSELNITPDYTAGHSLGEYCAMYTAGVMSLETTLKAIQKRADLMGQTKGGSMAAILNAPEGAVEEALKEAHVLSGGEKVRCVLSKMMLSGANFLIFDEPTNHLDMESITSVNEGMKKFTGNILFTSHDHELTQTVANRIIDIKKDGSVVDKECTYNEYLGLE